MIDLTRFCGPHRADIRRPFHLGERCAACNGKVLVVVDSVAECKPFEAATLNEPLRTSIDPIAQLCGAAVASGEGAWRNAKGVHLSAIPLCERCAGSGCGVSIPCEDCGGEGEFMRGRHSYECRECRGVGTFWAERPAGSLGAQPCDQCYGSGLGLGLVGAPGFGDHRFAVNSRLLHLVRDLPQCSIRETYIPLAWRDAVVFPFRFRGGFGGIMGMRRPAGARAA